MPLDYDTALENVLELQVYHSEHLGNRNEATTRSQLIDVLVYDCLGWARHDITFEGSYGGEYSDYVFYCPRPLLILEAKREGTTFEIPAGREHLTYRLDSLCHGNPSLRKAVDQVAGYCHKRGVQYAVVSNGWQIVAFIANRADGIPMLEGKALVFPSIQFMVDHFQDLWNALSKPGLEERRIAETLYGASRRSLPDTLAAQIAPYPGTKNRNPFQADLKALSELVIEDIPKARDLEQEFLSRCYCTHSALSQHSLASRTILQSRYASLQAPETSAPAVAPLPPPSEVSADFLSEIVSRRPILLLGDVGVGKTTFLRRLICIDAKDILESAITLYLDFGSQASFTSHLNDFIVTEIIEQLRQQYSLDVFANAFVRGVYNRDLQDFANGIFGNLRSSNPTEYLSKELEFLERRIADHSRHLVRSLEHIVRARRQQIVVFLDNADQRPPAMQDTIFLAAEEMASRWPVAVFLPLRPETFYRSSREGALTGYHPKAFTISPPRIEAVLKKRIEFALALCDGSIRVPTIPVDSASHLFELDLLLRAFLLSIQQSYDLIECIDNVSGGNARLSLELVRQFFGSGHVDTEKIVRACRESGSYLVPVHELLRAVIFQDACHYDPRSSPIVNVYDVSTFDKKEHFCLLLLLWRLAQAQRIANGFVDAENVYQFLQAIGYTSDQIDFALLRACRRGLIELSTRLGPDEEPRSIRSVRVTPVGLYHSQRLSMMFTYTDAVLVCTPVLEESKRDLLQNVQSIRERLIRAVHFVDYLDGCWNGVHGALSGFDWGFISRTLRRNIDSIRSRSESPRRAPDDH